MCTHLRHIKPNIQAGVNRRGGPLKQKYRGKHAAIRSVWLLRARDEVDFHGSVGRQAVGIQLLKLLSDRGGDVCVVASTVGHEHFALNTR